MPQGVLRRESELIGMKGDGQQIDESCKSTTTTFT